MTSPLCFFRSMLTSLRGSFKSPKKRAWATQFVTQAGNNPAETRLKHILHLSAFPLSGLRWRAEYGQALTQLPQPIHCLSSMVIMPPVFLLVALTGQTGTQGGSLHSLQRWAILTRVTLG